MFHLVSFFFFFKFQIGQKKIHLAGENQHSYLEGGCSQLKRQVHYPVKDNMVQLMTLQNRYRVYKAPKSISIHTSMLMLGRLKEPGTVCYSI